jgi:hypothetical protein
MSAARGILCERAGIQEGGEDAQVQERTRDLPAAAPLQRNQYRKSSTDPVLVVMPLVATALLAADSIEKMKLGTNQTQ